MIGEIINEIKLLPVLRGEGAGRRMRGGATLQLVAPLSSVRLLLRQPLALGLREFLELLLVHRFIHALRGALEIEGLGEKNAYRFLDEGLITDAASIYELTAERVAGELEELRGSLEEGLAGAEAEATFEMRYRGQAFELPVPGPIRPDPAELAEGFAAAHERRYGYRDPDAEVELVTIRLAMVLPGPMARTGRMASTAPTPPRSRASMMMAAET